MAITIQVSGLVTVKTDTGGSHALESLCYTRNGAEFTFDGYFHDVHTDENGGDDGPLVDSQYLGETCRIRLQVPKFDSAVFDKVVPRLYAGTAGTVANVGGLMIGGGFTYRLCLSCTTRPYNFPIVMFRQPYEIGKGTKYSEWVIEAIAYQTAATGVLYNATVA